jgi:sugar/nucleoside kinase (ribokinase family)
MTQTALDVIGVGNAIVDVIAQTTDEFLVEHEIAKGAMTLIDEDRAKALYDAMGPAREISGGSGANSIAGIASLGGKAGYVGKVANDALGEIFTHDLRAVGVEFNSNPLVGGPATARSFILVTPDAQRSMNTYLGASALVTEKDVEAEADAFRSAQITYLEGYLFDREEAKRSYVAAAEIAAASGRRTALTLSDLFCVQRHRAAFRHLVANHVDILLANEDEIKSLYETDSFEHAMQQARADVGVAAVTRSEKGAVIARGDETAVVRAEPVEKVIDTTGAGDLFAAGFLLGMARGRPLAECSRLGSICAAEIISHYGARPEAKLDALSASAGIEAF